MSDDVPIAPRLTPRFEQALSYASELHRAQTRKASDTPYIAHLLSVTAMVLEDGGDEEEAIAALLHDAIEDQGGAAAREGIRRRFGNRVVSIIDECTEVETLPKPPWRQRKEEHIERMRVATPSALRVLAADKLHNVRSLLADYRRLGSELWERFNGGREGTLWYYRSMVALLEESGRTELIAELDRTLTALEGLVAESEGS